MNREEFLLRERDLERNGLPSPSSVPDFFHGWRDFPVYVMRWLGAARAVLDRRRRMREFAAGASTPSPMIFTFRSTLRAGLRNPEIHLLPCRRRRKSSSGLGARVLLGHLGARA